MHKIPSLLILCSILSSPVFSLAQEAENILPGDHLEAHLGQWLIPTSKTVTASFVPVTDPPAKVPDFQTRCVRLELTPEPGETRPFACQFNRHILGRGIAAGERATFRCWMRSQEARTINVSFGEVEAPYTAFRTQDFPLPENEWVQVELSGVAKTDLEAKSWRVGIALGKEPGAVEIAEIFLSVE